MAPSQSYIPPVPPQAPINVLTASMSVGDPAGLARTIVPLAQQTQPPATPIQLTDIIPQAAPQQTQPVMISQQTIVQQQQIGMDPQNSTLQQQLQQQMEATLLEQQVSTTQPPMDQHPQSLSATAVQTHQHEPQQQIYVQQPAPPDRATPQKVLPIQTSMEQRVMSLPQPGDQPPAYKPQSAGDTHEQTMIQPQQLQLQQTLLQQQQQQALLLEQHQTYVKQQLNQEQQKALLQQQQQNQAQIQQHQLEQALIQKKLMDQQQQQTLKQQEQQPQQVLLQHQLEQQQQQASVQQQQQSQLYQQIGQHQAGIQKESETQRQHPIILQQQPQQTQHYKEQLQQQIMLQKMEQQQQQQKLIQQHLQQQAILQQHQLQQKIQLQQQQQEQQQVQLKQQMEQQQQALLQQQLEQQHQQHVLYQQQQAERLQQQALMQQQIQERQHTAVSHLQHAEKHEVVPIPKTNSEQQIQQQLTDIQHVCIPQLNSQFPPHTTLTQQQAAEQQQHAALIQQQQAFVGQPQHHTSLTEPHIPVGVPACTEVIHQTQIVSQTQVPMASQTMQIPVQMSAVVPARVLTQQGQSEAFPQTQGQLPVQFVSQSSVQAAQAMIEPQGTPQAPVIQGQPNIIKTQHITLQTSYPGPVTSPQSQITPQPLIQSQPLHLTINQSLPQHGQGPSVETQKMAQQSQTVQPPAAITSIHSQIQDETLVHQTAQMSGPMPQPQLQQQSLGPPGIQTAACLLAPQSVSQSAHQARLSVPQDVTHISEQQQQEKLQQYQQVKLSSCSAGSVGPTTDLSPTADPANFVTTSHTVQQPGQTCVPGQTALHPVVQAQQQHIGASAPIEPLVTDPISHPTMHLSTGQYPQQLQKISQPLAPPSPQNQLLAQLDTTSTQQPVPPKQALIPCEESQPPTPPASQLVTDPTAQAVPNNGARPQSQNRTMPIYSNFVAGVPLSPQHLAKQMLPAHTHTQTSIQSQTHSQTQTHVQTQAHSHTQTHTEAPISEQPVLHHAHFPAPQMPLSPSHTSCPPTSLPSLPSIPSYHPAAAPMSELPTPPPVAQVTLPGQAVLIPTSPPPVTILQSLDSNTPKLPQASLQDCDPSLLAIAQVQKNESLLY